MFDTHIYISTWIYIYIYIYLRVCIYVCVCMELNILSNNVELDNIRFDIEY